jgi:hypothetical protein
MGAVSWQGSVHGDHSAVETRLVACCAAGAFAPWLIVHVSETIFVIYTDFNLSVINPLTISA